MQDIFFKEYTSNLDLKDKNISKSAKVHTKEGIDIFQDISCETKKDIFLFKKRKILLWKKKWKNFDALERKKRGYFFLKSKNIKLSPNKEKFSFFIYFLYISRFFKKRSILWQWILIFLVIIWVLILWYFDKNLIENRVNAGYEKLVEIKGWHLSLSDIQKKVNNARFDLLLADTFFFPFSLIPWEKIQSVWHVISAGRHISRWLDDMLGLYTKLDNFIEQKTLQSIYFTQLFLNISPELRDIEKSLEKTLWDYKSITWLPNSELQEKKETAIKEIEKLYFYINKLNTHFSDFLNILWHKERKRYLIVFQNADEIRPTGWFMGSMWLLEIFRWKVQLFQKKDVYAIEWDLKKSNYERLKAPKWINTLTESFGLRDANYYVNLKDSSNTIKFFTDRAGIDIDGIIYINQNILLKLLELTGPVYFEKLDKNISSENFSEIMSLVVEAKTFKKGTLWSPKQILFDFMEVFSKKLLSNSEYFNYLQVFIHDIESRDIMMWSFNEKENNFLELFWINGKINYDQTFDFAYPIYTSLSGNKSDRYMKRRYKQTVTKWENCSYNISLEIQNTHDMWKLKRERIQKLIAEYKLDSPNLFQIQWAATNKQFMRVILPSQSQIQAKKWMDIVDYGKRKWVEFFLNTRLQETSSYTIDYVLSNPECKPYTYMLYKQPGIAEYAIDIDLNGEKFSYAKWEEDFPFEERK